VICHIELPLVLHADNGYSNLNCCTVESCFAGNASDYAPTGTRSQSLFSSTITHFA
jgi:hypothetical protein